MATELLSGGGYGTAETCITALNTAVSGATVVTTAAAFPPTMEVIKEGNTWRYYFIYEAA